MPYYTKQQARDAASATVRRSFTSLSAKDVINESIRKSTDHESFDVFLCHSISDAELVLGVKTLLEQEGLKVYVDWHSDPLLSRCNVNKDTAEILRRRMKQSHSLIYIATDNSSSSKWMPWELGYFDGHKPGTVGILPLMDYEYSSFTGQEYLSLYPEVSKGQYSNGTKDVFVEEKGHHWTTLRRFGSGSPTWTSYI